MAFVKRFLLSAALTVAVAATHPSAADVGPPAQLQISETESGVFSVQWRVPKTLPPRAIPRPELPESCRGEGDPTGTDNADAWFFRREWRCESGIAGQSVGMLYPFPEFALTTVVRVDLLSGDRFAHVLEQGENSWLLPEGTSPPDRLREAQRAVVAGAAHVATSWVHLSFLLVLGLLRDHRQSLAAVSAFSVGQLAGLAASGWVPGLDAATAEIGLATAVALLAREALRPADQRRRISALAIAAGLIHGSGLAAELSTSLGDDGLRSIERLLAILGMDATHVCGILAVAAVAREVTKGRFGAGVSKGLAYGAGATGVALALALAIAGEPGSGNPSAVRLPDLPQTTTPGRAAPAASRRLAPSTPNAAVQSFFSIEPFEIRHEAMLRISGLTLASALDPGAILSAAEQRELLGHLERLVVERTAVEADGSLLEGSVRRADFMVVDPTGALPRVEPVEESVAEAVVGIVLAYPTTGVPQQASLRWEFTPQPPSTIPVTVIDPESVRTVGLSSDEPVLIWTNSLEEDPMPTVLAVQVEPIRVALPLISLPLFALGAGVLVVGTRRRRRTDASAVARVLVALAVVVGPLAQTAVALPGSAGAVPSERQARRILAALLPNIYRALEFRDESTIFDRLNVSVTGETLTDVYLEQRKALEIEERGGAQARVEAVEVTQARDIEALDSGFGVRSRWTVGGMVTHFGHRHFRQNRYEARIEVVPVDGTWKIRSIEITEQDRIR
jgi:hypothetical protein